MASSDDKEFKVRMPRELFVKLDDYRFSKKFKSVTAAMVSILRGTLEVDPSAEDKTNEDM